MFFAYWGFKPDANLLLPTQVRDEKLHAVFEKTQNFSKIGYKKMSYLFPWQNVFTLSVAFIKILQCELVSHKIRLW